MGLTGIVTVSQLILVPSILNHWRQGKAIVIVRFIVVVVAIVGSNAAFVIVRLIVVVVVVMAGS